MHETFLATLAALCRDALTPQYSFSENWAYKASPPCPHMACIRERFSVMPDLIRRRDESCRKRPHLLLICQNHLFHLSAVMVFSLSLSPSLTLLSPLPPSWALNQCYRDSRGGKESQHCWPVVHGPSHWHRQAGDGPEVCSLDMAFHSMPRGEWKLTG